MNNKSFLLYECCVPVKGKEESIIMDLQRGSFIKIPNLLFDILDIDLRSLRIKDLKLKYKNFYDEGINAYIDYLLEKEYGFLTEEPYLFPKIDFSFKSPYKVVSSIICINKNSKYSLLNVLKQLDELGCQLIQIRIFNFYDIKKLYNVLGEINEARVKVIEIYIEDFNYDLKVLLKIMRENNRVKIIVHSSSKKKILPIFENKSSEKLVFTSKKITEQQKEIYRSELFTCNMEFFSESKNFNIGLNRKICIDSNGSIKNYLSHEKVYGNIEIESLKDVIESKSFQKLWFITNDEIEKCKDCQFRYMCLSNSDIITNKGKNYKVHYCNIYS